MHDFVLYFGSFTTGALFVGIIIGFTRLTAPLEYNRSDEAPKDKE